MASLKRPLQTAGGEGMWEASLAAGDMDLFIESMFDLEGTLIDIKESLEGRKYPVQTESSWIYGVNVVVVDGGCVSCVQIRC
jgi:hypothetical protein